MFHLRKKGVSVSLYKNMLLYNFSRIIAGSVNSFFCTKRVGLFKGR